MDESRRTSTTALSSGISSAQSLPGEIDASLFDEDVFPARETTPLLARVPDDLWYMRLLSEWCIAWENVRGLWRRPDGWSKFTAAVCFVLLPFRAIQRAASPYDHVTIPDHASVCYLFLLMCYTFVVNLVKSDDDDVAGDRRRRDVFISSCMALAIASMLYIFLFTRGRVRHDPRHDAPIRIFFRGGLYIFGFASILNSICLLYEDFVCSSRNSEVVHSERAVQILKASFVVAETLFLGYFHKATFPINTKFLQIFLAHILGTNLALWFWTLCEEFLEGPNGQKCISNSTDMPDLGWRDYRKYFYPVFVEYLILALAILYGLWKNLRQGEETLCRFCKNCARCLYRSQNPAPEEENDEDRPSFRQRYIPRCRFGITIGIIYVAGFLFTMLWAIENATTSNQLNATNQTTNYDTTLEFKAYCGASIVMYMSMICACYIILASLRSPNRQRLRSIDYDDVLLYISLMGILLLEGFHVVSKKIKHRTYFHLVAVDITGTVQHLTQVVTLMSLSHYHGATSRRNRVWICECILFLFLANLAWWIEDSFYLSPNLTRPGEVETIEEVKTYGTIVSPMVIFFRFHSATYFYNAWTIYRL